MVWPWGNRGRAHFPQGPTILMDSPKYGFQKRRSTDYLHPFPQQKKPQRESGWKPKIRIEFIKIDENGKDLLGEAADASHGTLPA